MSRSGAFWCISFIALLAAGGCSIQYVPPSPDARSDVSGRVIVLPEEGESWTPARTTRARPLSERGSITIDGVGTFRFSPSEVTTVRSDVFADGSFSMFDVLVHVAGTGGIDLSYHYDPDLATNVIDSIDGMSDWWYDAYYSGGWPEPNAFRMDLYPYKDGTTLRLQHESPDRLRGIHDSFRQEVERRTLDRGGVVVPSVTIEDPTGTRAFSDVAVRAHDVRSDILRPGTVTALDVLLSLGEDGKLSHVGLDWYSMIGSADPVDNYFVDRIDDMQAQVNCGYVYEEGARQFAGLGGNHIHIPADVRVLVSPEYVRWFWLCL
jgi:hypothetical protein